MEEQNPIPEELDISEAFKIILTIGSLSDPSKEIARLIQDNSLSEHSINEVLKKYHIKSIIGLKEEMLDLVLMYINIILNDNKLTQNEFTNVKRLKAIFKIRERDFYRYRHHEIKEILYKQLTRIYRDDNRIDDQEALYKVELQELFGLGYDQFLEFANTEDSQALERGANVFNLDTFMPNKKFLFIEDEVARNMITQELKDIVRERDNDKCAVCHGYEELDYDHIVPLLKGGSNTSRNIRLLCRKCRVNKD
jgi:hypothetical protein